MIFATPRQTVFNTATNEKEKRKKEKEKEKRKRKRKKKKETQQISTNQQMGASIVPTLLQPERGLAGGQSAGRRASETAWIVGVEDQNVGGKRRIFFKKEKRFVYYNIYIYILN